jgi:hypothetical protein
MGAEERVRQTLRGLTAAWRDGRLEDVPPYFRANVVFVQPGFGEGVQGRDACLETYRQFLALATIHGYQEDEPVIHVFDDTAVATIRFEIDYELESGRFQETGHDIVVLKRDGGTWLVAWRTLVPGPPLS